MNFSIFFRAFALVFYFEVKLKGSIESNKTIWLIELKSIRIFSGEFLFFWTDWRWIGLFAAIQASGWSMIFLCISTMRAFYAMGGTRIRHKMVLSAWFATCWRIFNSVLCFKVTRPALFARGVSIVAPRVIPSNAFAAFFRIRPTGERPRFALDTFAFLFLKSSRWAGVSSCGQNQS